MTTLPAAAPVEPTLRFREEPDGRTWVELVLDGRVVSRLQIIPYTIRIGAATVRMDGIGDVETEQDCRHRGYARRVLEATVQRMKRGDAALSMLYGIPDFYPKFGYATAGPDHFIHLTDLPGSAGQVSLPDGWTARPYVEADLPAVRRLYERNTVRSVGAAVRAAADPIWSKLKPVTGDRTDPARTGEPAAVCRVVEGPDGQAAAYAWRARGFWYVDDIEHDDPDAVVFAEVMADGAASADAVLALCRAWAAEVAAQRERPVKRVTLGLPPEGPVARAAMLQSARFKRRFSASGDSMARVLDVQRLLTALAPELTERVRAASHHRSARLVIQTDEGAATLNITPDSVTVAEQDGASAAHSWPGDRLSVRLPQTALARLALGAFPPADLLARLDHPVDGAARELLEALFPLRHPHMHYPDRY